MKRLLTGALALLLSVVASATTLNPIQLLNPAGSTSGQAIVSTGASTAPAWAGVNAVTLNGATFASPGAIGSTTPGAGSFTSLSASGAVTGTGFNNLFASPPNLGSTAPATGAFTALSATGNFTPSQTNGIVGTTTNNNANAGSVGEYISSSIPVGSAVSLTTGVNANVTSISVTAGDWMICGSVATAPNASTVQQSLQAAISTTSATLNGAPNGGAFISLPYTAATGFSLSAPVGCMRQSFSSTTTVYLVIQVGFTVSTNAAFGFIGARRVR